jgi:hypothetical protein
MRFRSRGVPFPQTNIGVAPSCAATAFFRLDFPACAQE